MLCPSCGKEIAETDALCGFCGSSLSQDKPPSGESLPSASVAASLGRPEQPLRRSRKAIASLILGLLSFIPGVGLLAVIFGHSARASIRRSGGRLRGERMAAAGLVLGYLGLVGWIYFVIFIVPQPDFSRIASHEASAMGSLRIINTAAITYSSTYDRGFPPTLAVLGPPKAGNPNASVKENEKAAGLIDEVLASGTKSGYRFTYVAGKVGSTGKIASYTVHADPIKPGVTGKMYLFTDESGVILREFGKEANQHSPPIQ